MDLLAPASVGAVVLFAARVSGLVMVAPVFSAKSLPMMLRATLIVLLTWLLAPVALKSAQGAVPLTPAVLLSETLVGFAIGFGVALLVGAAEVMGDLLSVQIGLSGAAVLDPLTNQQVPVLGQFSNLFALALLLAMDAHLVMLDALAASTRVLPVGGATDMPAGAAALVGLGGSLFVLGLRFAAPIIAVVLLANAALAIMGRAAPQLNVLAVAFPVQIGLGLLALFAALPLIATYFINWEPSYDAALTRVFSAFAGGGR